MRRWSTPPSTCPRSTVTSALRLCAARWELKGCEICVLCDMGASSCMPSVKGAPIEDTIPPTCASTLHNPSHPASTLHNPSHLGLLLSTYSLVATQPSSWAFPYFWLQPGSELSNGFDSPAKFRVTTSR